MFTKYKIFYHNKTSDKKEEEKAKKCQKLSYTKVLICHLRKIGQNRKRKGSYLADFNMKSETFLLCAMLCLAICLTIR